MTKTIWTVAMLAESDHTRMLGGNHYFHFPILSTWDSSENPRDILCVLGRGPPAILTLWWTAKSTKTLPGTIRIRRTLPGKSRVMSRFGEA
jgi:hypothetical protein